MNERRRIYQTALGIQTGDIVSTSYGTGPYEVWSIRGPQYVERRGVGVWIIRTWPVVSLGLVKPGEQPAWHTSCPFFIINTVRQEGDRWFTDAGDEVFVTPSRVRFPLPVDMFRSFPPLPEPYLFQPGVDYQAGDGLVWRCERCGTDFNAPGESKWGPAWCPRCNRPAGTQLVIMTMDDGG